MSRRRLPPLNALRAFEATARNKSMSRAADELCVTHSAISRHIAKLEQFLGASLFDRNTRQLRPTRQGAAYAAKITRFLDEVSEATSTEFSSDAAESTIRINVPPTFASRWLLPRLTRFLANHPRLHIDLSISSENDFFSTDFDQREFDIFVRRGAIAEYRSSPCHHLFDEVLVPVYSPNLNGTAPLKDVEHFHRFTHLHAQRRVEDWAHWLRAAGTRADGCAINLCLENSDYAYQGAAHGLGIAMAQTAYVHEDLKQGRLVPASNLKLATHRAYYSGTRSKKNAPSPVVASFVSWLADQAEVFRREHVLYQI
jgi:LysR family glycine cleavage system transcriptional activator